MSEIKIGDTVTVTPSNLPAFTAEVVDVDDELIYVIKSPGAFWTPIPRELCSV